MSCKKGKEINKIMTTETNKSSRVPWLDVLRIVATFAVIMLHVSSLALYSKNMDYGWYVSVVYDSMVRWAVPVFVMISGSLFLKPEKEVGVRQILRKYIPRLLTAYAFWWMSYSLMRACYDTAVTGVFTFKMGYFLPHFHLWFLPMLAGVYLLIPFLRIIAEDEFLMKYGLTLWGVWMLFSFKLLPEFPQWSKLFVMNQVVGFAGYFLFGRWLSTRVFEKKHCRVVYGAGAVAFGVTIAGMISVNKSIGGGNTDFMNTLTPWVAAMSTAVFMVVKENARNAGRARHIVSYVRKDLFGIYLTHGIWLMLLNVPTLRGLCNIAITIPVLTMVIFLLSLYTTKLIRKIPFMHRVVE